MIVQMDNGALANIGSSGTLHAGGPEQEMVVQIYCDQGVDQRRHHPQELYNLLRWWVCRGAAAHNG